MGAWEVGFWSDDTTLDVRDDYLDGLRRKLSPDEVVAQLIDKYEMDTDPDSYLCWIAIALLQWNYGHLSEEMKTKALDLLHSGADEEYWVEVPERTRQKRKKVMEQVEAKLLSVNEKPKHVKPYAHKRTKWKVGDIISLRFGTMKSYAVENYLPFQDLYGAVLVVDFWEQDLGDIYVNPIITLYDWVGASPAQKSDLEQATFFKTDFYPNSGLHYFWAADIPKKRHYSWYDLAVIGHLDTIPLQDERMSEQLIERGQPWGTIGAMIADHWLRSGRAIPDPNQI